MRGNIEELRVARAESEKPLQDFIAARCGLSRRAAKAIIDGRSVWVNRKCVWIAHHTLRTGDTVEVPRAVVSAAKRQGMGPATDRREEHSPAKADTRHLRVIVETPDYIVIDKPAGLLSTDEDGTGRENAETLLREQLKAPGLEAVHRLDRDTTGCLLFAKTHPAFLAAVEVFKTKKVQKTYLAIAAGFFEHAFETIQAPLDGKPAVSHVTREMATPDASLLRIRIETGRTNQIRRHLAGVRCPVIGDRMYGLKQARDPRLMAVRRQMLHAAHLELPDPMHHAKEGIVAHAPMPADFRATLKLFDLGKRAGRRACKTLGGGKKPYGGKSAGGKPGGGKKPSGGKKPYGGKKSYGGRPGGKKHRG